MTPIVSLPMYVHAPDALRAFWVGLRAHLRAAGFAEVPDHLSAPTDLEAHWRSPDLLLSQTCGYPLTSGLVGQVKLVGTPRYTAPGCRGSDYASVIVVRQGDAARTLEDLRGRRAAYNARNSQSGYNTFRALVAPLAREGRFFSDAIETGGHARSMHLIREGRADVAAIDCVTYALAARADPHVAGELRIIGLSDPAPGLPLITAGATGDDEIARLRSAFAAASTDPALAPARAGLLLDGLDVRPLADYDRCAAMEIRARSLGYPEIA